MTGARSTLGLEAYAEAVYPRYHFGWSDLRTLRAGRFKYIEAPRPELYDLEKDPLESTNVYDQHRAFGAQMSARLRRLEERFSKPAREASAPKEIDPDTRDRLASLGYVGTFALDRHRVSLEPGGSQGQDRAVQPHHARTRSLAAQPRFG